MLMMAREERTEETVHGFDTVEVVSDETKTPRIEEPVLLLLLCSLLL